MNIKLTDETNLEAFEQVVKGVFGDSCKDFDFYKRSWDKIVCFSTTISNGYHEPNLRELNELSFKLGTVHIQSVGSGTSDDTVIYAYPQTSETPQILKTYNEKRSENNE